jgi:isopenicillin-N N-acyltransferase like protein
VLLDRSILISLVFHLDILEKFPEITLFGNHREIVLQHGNLLRERILKNIEFYKKIWMNSEEEIFDTTEPFKQAIKDGLPKYAEEIKGIAEGAGVSEDWIYALNSRTEVLWVLRKQSTQECTSLYFKQNSILGQNWDWAKQLEDLVVIMRIKYDDYSILQMTEPGIIWKIGFNSYGLGVCLNILTYDARPHGIPIHVLLRLLLDSSSIRSFLDRVEPFKLGKASNMLIGDGSGNYIDIEFAVDRVFTLDNNQEKAFHTNHYLKEVINTDPIEFDSSFARYDRVTEVLDGTEPTVEGMKQLLGDQNNSQLPICRSYIPDEYIDNAGTVCTIIMDLPKRTMHITKGNPIYADF